MTPDREYVVYISRIAETCRHEDPRANDGNPTGFRGLATNRGEGLRWA